MKCQTKRPLNHILKVFLDSTVEWYERVNGWLLTDFHELLYGILIKLMESIEDVDAIKDGMRKRDWAKK